MWEDFTHITLGYKVFEIFRSKISRDTLGIVGCQEIRNILGAFRALNMSLFLKKYKLIDSVSAKTVRIDHCRLP